MGLCALPKRTSARPAWPGIRTSNPSITNLFFNDRTVAALYIDIASKNKQNLCACVAATFILCTELWRQLNHVEMPQGLNTSTRHLKERSVSGVSTTWTKGLGGESDLMCTTLTGLILWFWQSVQVFDLVKPCWCDIIWSHFRCLAQFKYLHYKLSQFIIYVFFMAFYLKIKCIDILIKYFLFSVCLAAFAVQRQTTMHGIWLPTYIMK